MRERCVLTNRELPNTTPAPRHDRCVTALKIPSAATKSVEAVTKKILVIDDSSMARQLVRNALEPAGYEIVEAPNWAEGLNLANDEDIVCILCDVNMPVMNGVEFLEALRGERPGAAPVLMVTTESEADVVRRARELGAVGWMAKPIKLPMLVHTVQKIIERSREERERCAS